jgi:hypothetical protein
MHPNKNFHRDSSNLHAKLTVSRTPIAPGNHKGKFETSNDQQQGVYGDKFTWLGRSDSKGSLSNFTPFKLHISGVCRQKYSLSMLQDV